jgi:hypothetical protein
MDSFLDSSRDRRRLPRDVGLLKEQEYAFTSGKIGSCASRKPFHHYHDYEQPFISTSEFLASSTLSEHQSVQDDFDDLQ